MNGGDQNGARNKKKSEFISILPSGLLDYPRTHYRTICHSGYPLPDRHPFLAKQLVGQTDVNLKLKEVAMDRKRRPALYCHRFYAEKVNKPRTRKTKQKPKGGEKK